MYTISQYGGMISDRDRVDAYARALQRAVRPGSSVVDIGTGTGIFALLACRFGAGKVYAIETDDVIEVARQIAAANGLGDRIEFIQADSTDVKLPEPAQVIVSDIGGMLPMRGRHLPAIVDARRRLLAPGGVLIPQQDSLWAALVASERIYRVVRVWEDSGYGFDMSAARQMAESSFWRAPAQPDEMLTEANCWATLDYRTIEGPNVSGELGWTVSRPGTAHGINVWFQATLLDEIRYCTEPCAPDNVYGAAFFPFSQPFEVSPGDRVSVALSANLVGASYVWRWNTSVFESGCTREPTVTLRQCSLAAEPMGRLRKGASDYVAALTEDGEIDRLVLNQMDGRKSLEDIARQVFERYPTRFMSWVDSLTRVGELSRRYSR
jgi:protein arginine N-methyltransferase 1